jgi:hypothetical protein
VTFIPLPLVGLPVVVALAMGLVMVMVGVAQTGQVTVATAKVAGMTAVGAPHSCSTV